MLHYLSSSSSPLHLLSSAICLSSHHNFRHILRHLYPPPFPLFPYSEESSSCCLLAVLWSTLLSARTANSFFTLNLTETFCVEISAHCMTGHIFRAFPFWAENGKSLMHALHYPFMGGGSAAID